jgi:hypothetical protein
MRALAENPKPAAGTFENIAGIRPAATVLRAVTLVGGIVYSSIPGLFGSVESQSETHRDGKTNPQGICFPDRSRKLAVSGGEKFSCAIRLVFLQTQAQAVQKESSGMVTGTK